MLVWCHPNGSTRNVRVKGLILSFSSENDEKKKFFPTGRVYLKKQTWVIANQHIFKSGLRNFLYFSVAYQEMDHYSIHLRHIICQLSPFVMSLKYLWNELLFPHFQKLFLLFPPVWLSCQRSLFYLKRIVCKIAKHFWKMNRVAYKFG